MQEREKPRGEIPLELKLLYVLSQDPKDGVQIGTSGQTAKLGSIADIMGFLWNMIGSSEVGGLPIPAKDRQEGILLDALSEGEIVELIGVLSIRGIHLDTLDTIGPASRALLVLDNGQNWLPGLPQRYYDALSKISNNQVVLPVPSVREMVNAPFVLIRKWITEKLFPRKIR